MPAFLAYHGLTGAEHQQRVDTLKTQGYRPVTVGVSGDPADARYCALWVQRPGPGWWAVHNLSAPQYQAKFDELVAAGYAPLCVSAAGPVETATFAAVFEQGVTEPWFARHGLRWDPESDPDTLVHENARAFRDGFIPRCLAVYGTPENRRFAGVWVKNTAATGWSWWLADPTAYQSIFDAELAGGNRPAWISVAPDVLQLAVFRDDWIGEWWARHGIAAADYQAEFDLRAAAGLMPVVVQAGGSGAATRYSAVFTGRETPETRRFTVTGQADLRLKGLDDVVETFMRAHAIRAGTLAVRRGNDLLVHRGYTYAEGGYAITQPDSRFRIASLSKIFTAAAVDRLVATGRLGWSTAHAYPLLGITGTIAPGQTVDPVIDTITVEQLVNHTSGLNQARVTEAGQVRAFEPTGDLRTVAARLGRTTTPTRDDVVRYMHGERTDFPPGTQEKYSNFGYLLLTSVIEAAAGVGFVQLVRNELLAPLNLMDLWSGATALSGRLPAEVFYDHPAAGLSVLQPAATVWAPTAYGGAFALEGGEGTGGLVSTAATVAKFIGTHAVWGMGGRRPGSRRYGTLDGTCTGAESRGDGIDFAYLFNRRVAVPDQDVFTNAIDAYLNTH